MENSGVVRDFLIAEIQNLMTFPKIMKNSTDLSLYSTKFDGFSVIPAKAGTQSALADLSY